LKEGEKKMIGKKNAREILNESKLRSKLEECFKKCADGRMQLRNCVVNAMDSGLNKEDVLTIINDMATGGLFDEASMCSIVAIGQALRYEEKEAKNEADLKEAKSQLTIEKTLRDCYKKCSQARGHLRECIVDALDAGLNKDEVLAISDDIVGGFGKDEVSLCAIIAVNQVLQYEESARAKPIDIIKERNL
jgi:hypothetical protein